jgi:hypothetical protein
VRVEPVNYYYLRYVLVVRARPEHTLRADGHQVGARDTHADHAPNTRVARNSGGKMVRDTHAYHSPNTRVTCNRCGKVVRDTHAGPAHAASIMFVPLGTNFHWL